MIILGFSMPQDSTYVITPDGDTVYIVSPDTTALLTHSYSNLEDDVESDSLWAGVFVLSCFFVVFMIPYLLGSHARRAGQFINRQFSRQKGARLYNEYQQAYDRYLNQHFPYYRKLSVPYKERFLKRTLTFMSAKEFEFVDLNRREEMPLLISAAAVQLTFGLDNYLMDHFKTIYVLHHDYHYGLNSVPFQGHVNHNGIYLSWTNFVKAFDNYEDGDNVGLHEMAHALSYVNFTANNGSDDGFKERFRQFSPTGRAYFYRVQQGETGFLGNYAATNYEEFWAVCVENFFERPAPFKALMPELYDAMCKLLNQDMLAFNIVLSPVEAA
jgi:Mlc titration factor MtfA (ptsG expression regulator)